MGYNKVSKPKRTHHTPETFKQTFKVGDVIESWSTCKRLRITAIGESRFLGKDYKGDERVCTMAFTQGWTKVDEVTPPNIGW